MINHNYCHLLTQRVKSQSVPGKQVDSSSLGLEPRFHGLGFLLLSSEWCRAVVECCSSKREETLSHKNLALGWKRPMIWTLGKHFLGPDSAKHKQSKGNPRECASLLPNYVNMYHWLPFPSQLLADLALRRKVCFIQENKTGGDLRCWWIINWFWLGLLAHYESLKWWNKPSPHPPFPDELPIECWEES